MSCYLCDGSGKAWKFPSATEAIPLIFTPEDTRAALAKYEVDCNCCHGAGECGGRCDWLQPC